jgi:predicted ribonuclease toxin of YeeF-YezG toxin-antitoxin module
MNDKEIIYDLVKEVREEQKDIRADISHIKQVLTLNTSSLQEHMRRTDVLEKLYYSQTERIDSLEEPRKLRELLFKRYVKVAAFLTTTLTLAAAIAKWKGFI